VELFKELIELVFSWLRELGYWGIMFGLMLEVIPSEIVLAFGGFLVFEGRITFIEAVVFGTIGGTIAQIFVYWIGRYGGRPFIQKYGKYILIHQKHLDVSERWFNKYGTGMIFTARFIPVVRHAISIPAGIVRMPLLRFTVLTALAVIPWSIFFVYLGMRLGENWRQIDEKAEPYIIPFMIGSITLTIIYVAWKVRRGRKRIKSNAGFEGEKRTAHQLKFLGREYLVLNARHVRAKKSTQEFDHIVIGPNGVFHIETKYWAGSVRFTKAGMERSRNGTSEDPTNQLYRHEYVLKELLRPLTFKAPMTGVICFAHPDCQIEGSSPAFHVLKLDQLLHWIKTYRSSVKLNQKQIQDIKKIILENSTHSRASYK
jgi:membrane protein DedA with SNARE-associated domain